MTHFATCSKHDEVTPLPLCSEEPEQGHRVVDQIKLLQISRVLPFI